MSLPSIPTLPRDLPTDVVLYLTTMQEIVETLAGQRGSGREAAVLRGDVQTLPVETTSATEIAQKFNSLLGDLGSEN